MDKRQVERTLDEIAAAAVPESVALWPAVRAQVAGRAAQRARSGQPGLPLRMGPRGWAGLAVLGLLVVGATAYAAGPIFSKLLLLDDQLKPADAERLGRTLDLTQTQGDVTATVQWAYADGQRLLVAYSLKTADGRRFDPAGATLTDNTGAVLHSTGGYGVVGHSDILGVSLPPGENANVAIFDSPAGASGATVLRLHLSLMAAEYAPPSPATPEVTENTAQAQPAIRLAEAGPFEFDLEVPVVLVK